MIKRILYNLVAFCLGLVFILSVLFGVETYFRYKYDYPHKFFYTLNPKFLNHAVIFKRSFIPSKNDPPPRIFCLGGSTTQGNNMPVEKSFPMLLQFIFDSNHKQATVSNFGVNGVSSSTTNFFIRNILGQYNPNCAIIHDGYNDLPVVIKKSARTATNI